MTFHSLRSRILFATPVCIFALLFCILSGCGGGTTGTGSSSSTDFTGRVLDERGNGVAAQITISTGGAAFATQSDSSGNYFVEVQDPMGPVTITVGAATTSFTPSEPQAPAIQVDLILSGGGTVVDAVEIPPPTPTPGDEPTPRPTARPTSTPTPRPTAEPTPQTLTVVGNVEEGERGVLQNGKIQVVGRAQTRTTLKPNGNFTITTDADRDRIGFRLDSRAGTGKGFIENLPSGLVKIRVRLRAVPSGERLVVDLTVKGAVGIRGDGSEVPL